ncbi:nucleoside hydrolase [Phaeobacter sp. HF9A]|uniref:nucleoside hydrolase n=1 Tax=Phaeobacter sp. HF9A TaxID=2721561 RepID=UPI001430BB08|nr:nucleoside hydrolase [Phaeobacter sp. HF9A]NIZ12629.1 nucleoside hydrolase [Phaeobacter sp. HF9A]
MTKLIIDTDPGIDDAMAIFYAAAAPDIELLGLTTIFGNVTTKMATRNALRLLEAADLDLPVAHGAEKPLVLPPFSPSTHVHGDEGFGDIPAAEPKGKPVEEDAADFLIRMAREHRGELVLCPVGPLTNIALAVQRDPEFVSNCKAIVIMGGSLEAGGNITPHAEANIYHDPHAAEVVFAASQGKVTMVGLDVTLKILCTPEDFDGIRDRSPELGGMLKDMSRFYIKFYQEVANLNGCSLHDPAAVIACTHADLFQTRAVPVTVSTEADTSGKTQVATDARGDTLVAMDVDAEAVKALFLKRLSLLP